MVQNKTSHSSENKPSNVPEDKTSHASKMSSLNDLFVHFLNDMYDAEQKIAAVLPKMAEKAQAPDLRKAFLHHEKQTLEQINRLEQIFKLLNEKPRKIQCEAIKGILAEGEELAKTITDPETLDVGLVASGQAVEHYEICRYGTLKAWAEQLKYTEIHKLIEESLEEEKNADVALSKIATGKINKKAA